jgi:SAM-dependent methyltransferase
MSNGYLHGYTDEERGRLRVQAQVLSPWVHRALPYSGCKNLIEIGCGTGAQLELLLGAFPQLCVTGIDLAADQLDAARKNLAAYAERTTLVGAAAEQLPMSDSSFDAGFLCWILEHVADPARVLRELHRVLMPGAPVVISEVVNSTLHLEPRSPRVMQYWSAFNELQLALHGDPYVGAKLGHHLHHAGFRAIDITPRIVLFDDRDPDGRAAFCGYCTDLLLSAAPKLLASGRIAQPDVDAIRDELDVIGRGPGSVFFYTFVQARCVR